MGLICILEDEDASYTMKDGCAVALLDKEGRLEGMTDKSFAEKDDEAFANLLLSFGDTLMFNVEAETTAKGMWEKLKNIYEGKCLVNKIFL